MSKIEGAISREEQLKTHANGDFLAKHYPYGPPDSAVESSERTRIEIYKARQEKKKPQTR